MSFRRWSSILERRRAVNLALTAVLMEETMGHDLSESTSSRSSSSSDDDDDIFINNATDTLLQHATRLVSYWYWWWHRRFFNSVAHTWWFIDWWCVWRWCHRPFSVPKTPLSYKGWQIKFGLVFKSTLLESRRELHLTQATTLHHMSYFYWWFYSGCRDQGVSGPRWRGFLWFQVV